MFRTIGSIILAGLVWLAWQFLGEAIGLGVAFLFRPARRAIVARFRRPAGRGLLTILLAVNLVVLAGGILGLASDQPRAVAVAFGAALAALWVFLWINDMWTEARLVSPSAIQFSASSELPNER